MISRSTSCPQLLNRKFYFRSGAAHLLLWEQWNISVFKFIKAHYSPLVTVYSCAFFHTGVLSMRSAASPVIPFRAGIHDRPKQCKGTQTFTAIYTKCMIVHTDTSSEQPEEREVIKGCEENDMIVMKRESLRPRRRRSKTCSTEMNLASLGMCAFLCLCVCVYPSCFAWCNAEISNPITKQTSLAA